MLGHEYDRGVGEEGKRGGLGLPANLHLRSMSSEWPQGSCQHRISHAIGEVGLSRLKEIKLNVVLALGDYAVGVGGRNRNCENEEGNWRSEI